MSDAIPATPAIRPARKSDMSALRALETACFGRDAWGEVALQGELDAVPETRFVVVLEFEGEIAGYASLLSSGRTADVQRIAVRPERWRYGLGRRLLDAVLEEARARGCSEALLEVRSDNRAAIALYEAYDFEVIANRPSYYEGGKIDALVLRRSLEEPS